MDMVPKIAVIGGSGVYRLGLLSPAKELQKFTAYGLPSAEIVVGTSGEKGVAFLARHGRPAAGVRDR